MCLLHLSADVWRRRGIAKKFGLKYNEEPATEVLLQDLALYYPGNVTIIPFSHHWESQFGADWAWGFVGPGGSHFQGMLVQAKRLDDSDKDYTELDHSIGNNRSDPTKLQIEVLIDSGFKYGLPPVYAFYNHLDTPQRIPRKLCPSLAMVIRKKSESWGVTIASAIAVRDKASIADPTRKTDKTFDSHRRHSIPLHCILCSKGRGHLGPSGSAGAATDALYDMFKSTTYKELWSKIEPLFEPQPEWPGPFRPFEEIYKEGAPSEEMRNIDLSDKFPGIAGVVIIRDP